jgi:hypothetical protein
MIPKPAPGANHLIATIEIFSKILGTLKIAAIWKGSNPSRASYIQATKGAIHV